jgi:hypothetical protein
VGLSGPSDLLPRLLLLRQALSDHREGKVTSRLLPEQVPEGMMLGEILYQCLRQNAHLDESNAAIHTAPVRYSPLTFRIAEYLWNHFPSYRDNTLLHSVILDSGQYEEDPGR